MFLVNTTNNIVVASAPTIKETACYFVANNVNYVKIDLQLVRVNLPEDCEVGKTTYTAEASFIKIGGEDNGTEVGEATEETETETETEKVDANPEAPEGN